MVMPDSEDCWKDLYMLEGPNRDMVCTPQMLVLFIFFLLLFFLIFKALPLFFCFLSPLAFKQVFFNNFYTSSTSSLSFFFTLCQSPLTSLFYLHSTQEYISKNFFRHYACTPTLHQSPPH